MAGACTHAHINSVPCICCKRAPDPRYQCALPLKTASAIVDTQCAVKMHHETGHLFVFDTDALNPNQMHEKGHTHTHAHMAPTKVLHLWTSTHCMMLRNPRMSEEAAARPRCHNSSMERGTRPYMFCIHTHSAVQHTRLFPYTWADANVVTHRGDAVLRSCQKECMKNQCL